MRTTRPGTSARAASLRPDRLSHWAIAPRRCRLKGERRVIQNLSRGSSEADRTQDWLKQAIRDLEHLHLRQEAWGQVVAREHPELVRIGYIGSYARGDWGVGSDVDLVVVVSRSEVPDLRRAAEFDATDLPVPADVLVYTFPA